jgi:hypothetical protein
MGSVYDIGVEDTVGFLMGDETEEPRHDVGIVHMGGVSDEPRKISAKTPVAAPMEHARIRDREGLRPPIMGEYVGTLTAEIECGRD